MAIAWIREVSFAAEKAHSFVLTRPGFKDSAKQESLEFIVAFASQPLNHSLPDAAVTFAASADHWQLFWTSSGAIEFAESRDVRAIELERRVVLSQYLRAIQCAGSTPPQETGLTVNSWYGKFHLEMHWWHAAHFTLWNRLPLFEKSLAWYESILPAAKALADSQGYVRVGPRWWGQKAVTVHRQLGRY